MDNKTFIDILAHHVAVINQAIESGADLDAVGDLFHVVNVFDRLKDEGYLDKKGMVKPDLDENDIPDWAMMIVKDTGKTNEASADDATGLKNTVREYVNKFLAAYPDDTTSWSHATQELVDLYETLLEDVNADSDVYKDINTTRSSTPSEYVTKFKRAINELLDVAPMYAYFNLVNMYGPWFVPRNELRNLTARLAAYL